MSLLAVDIGSSACKAVLFAADGQILAKRAAGYRPEFPRPCFAEMDPETFWSALCSTSRAVAQDRADPVQALCLSSHGETFVPVDGDGRPLSHAILNQDSRALEESNWCEATIGRERLFQITGLVAHPMYPVPKILWLRKHRAEMFARTRSFLTLIGYLLEKMGVPGYVDYSLASRFLAFDIKKRAWSDEILRATGLDPACFPVPLPAGTTVGNLKPEIAGQLGLPAGTPVVLGGHDQPCGALGAGVIDGGRVSDSMGTYECLLAVTDLPSLSEKAREYALNSYCHVVPDKFVTLAYFPSGIMLQWLHDLLYANGSGEVASSASAEDGEARHYALLEAHAPKGPTGLCITPHLIGTCNPDFNPRVRGFIAGLNPSIRRAHLYKGILEGLACELSIVSQALEQAVGRFEDIYVTGGGTSSPLGLELRAALTGCRLHVMSRQEAVCLGTAILAGVAIGEYESISQAVTGVVEESAVWAPNPAVAASYRDQADRYRQLRSVAVEQA
ncbi:MAG TPA: FGGY-family carbohydrate kinase [Terriglobales bacterium]|nr:FGGY-family carbohydrate kinase [Terriglobales bacterium]